jgi:CRP-like cAMP-binding protein
MNIIASVCAVRQCPLYRVGDALENSGPRVSGRSRAPVCARALGPLVHALDQIRAGSAPERFEGTSCQGCNGGHAWFNFSVGRASPLSYLPGHPGLSALSRNPLLGRAEPERLRQALSLFMEMTVQKGQVIVAEGRAAKGWFILVSGYVQLFRSLNDRTICTVLYLGPGQCFGETSLRGGEPSPMGARALTDGKVLWLPPERRIRLLKLYPDLYAQIGTLLGERLARVTAALGHHLTRMLSGQLGVLGPADLVGAIVAARLTGLLTAVRDGVRVEVGFEKGRVCAVRSGGIEGEGVFQEFILWTRGEFRFDPNAPLGRVSA